MDPVVVQAGTALVKLMATDVWSGAKDVVVGWWRKHHPEQAGKVGTDLDQLHTEVVQAGADEAIRNMLAGDWQARLWRLVTANPELVVELRRLLDEELEPLLLQQANSAITITQHSTVKGDNNFSIQAGGDVSGLSTR